MARSASLTSSERSIEEVFSELLGATLAQLADRHAAADLTAAVAVLADAVETIGEELILVDMPEAEM